MGNSQSRSMPSKPCFRATLMEDWMNAARLVGLPAMAEKVAGSAPAPPIERMALDLGVAVWRVEVKAPIH